MIAGLFMITGCVEEYEADLPEGETRLLVVNGSICSNQHNEFQLTWSSSLNDKSGNYLNNMEAMPVVGAKVTICGTDGTKYECEETKHMVSIYTEKNDDSDEYYDSDENENREEYVYEYGFYSCDLPELDPNVSYFLTIKYEKDTYQSTPEKPIRTPDIETLEYFQKDSLSDVEILLTTAAPDDADKTLYYTWDYTETWEVRPVRTTYIIFDPAVERKIRYRVKDEVFPKRGWLLGHSQRIITESTVNYAGGKFCKYQILSIPRNDERISWNYCHDIRQRAISKAEYEYEIACRQAGWEMGGLFTPQPSALPSNIRCITSSKRAIGYVGCSQNVATKRVYVDGEKISRITPKASDVYLKLYWCTDEDCMDMQNQGMVLFEWDDRRDLNGPLVTGWGTLADFDVRQRGATTDKPDYMPPFDEE